MASPEAVMKAFAQRMERIERIVEAIAGELKIDLSVVEAGLEEVAPPDRATLKSMAEPPTTTPVPDFEGTEIEVMPPEEPDPTVTKEAPKARSSKKKSAAD